MYWTGFAVKRSRNFEDFSKTRKRGRREGWSTRGDERGGEVGKGVIDRINEGDCLARTNN